MRIGQATPTINSQPVMGWGGHNVLDRVAPKTFLGPRINHHTVLNVPRERRIAFRGVNGLGSCTFMGGGRYRDDRTGNLMNAYDPAICDIGSSPQQSQVDGTVLTPPDQTATTNFFGTPLTVASLATYLGQNQQNRENLTRWLLQTGQQPDTPAQCRVRLYEEAQAYCVWNPGVCNGVDIDGLISSMVSQYTAHYNAEVRYYAGEVQAGSIYAPAGVPLSQLPQNLIPTSTVQPAPAPTQPVQPTQPNLNQPTTTFQTMTGNAAPTSNEPGTNQDITQLLKDNWVFIALGAGALVLLPMLGRK